MMSPRTTRVWMATLALAGMLTGSCGPRGADPAPDGEEGLPLSRCVRSGPPLAPICHPPCNVRRTIRETRVTKTSWL